MSGSAVLSRWPTAVVDSWVLPGLASHEGSAVRSDIDGR